MMAAVDSKLFRELKTRYPEVPDHVVASCMTQLGNDRDRCMATLISESPKYLFGQNCHVNDQLTRLNDMSVAEPRPRSDSSGSNMSNTSSGSASSRPPFQTSHSLVNVPGYRGPIMTSSSDDNHPSTAPVIPSDINEFNQFINYYGNERNSQSTIPNIDCNNSRTYDGQVVNYAMNYGSSGNSPPNASQQVQSVLRPIEVQHIQTNKDQKEHNNGSSQPPNVTYKFRFDPSKGDQGASSHMTPNNQSQSSNRVWVHHPVSKNYNSAYQNVTFPNNPVTAFSPDLRSQQTQPQYSLNLPPSTTPQYNSPTEEHRHFGLPSYNQNQYNPQHSSQTTIYLHNPVSPNPQYNTTTRVDRTINSPVPGQYIHTLASDPRMSPNFMRNPSVTGQQQTISSNPQNVQGRPFVVEIKTAGRDNTGVQSHIRHFNKMAGAPGSSSQVGGSGQQTIGQSSVIGHFPQHDNYVPDNSYDRLYTPELPTVINIQGPNTSQDEAGFLKFPPMPNVCRVPGHPHGPPVKSASTESESGYRSELDYRQRPYLSPASSHSSLSSESSPAIRERPRSNSIQDDPAYLQALLSHQKSRLEKLSEDLSVAEQRNTQLKTEVTELERSVIERKRTRKFTFPLSVDLAQLRGDNLQLQADIQMMTREIDLFNNGQTPLGVLDPIEQQNFYKNMNTGQRGSIYGNTTQAPPRMFTSTVTTAVTTSSSTPTRTRPPPEIPPTLPPRDNHTRDVPPPLPPRPPPPRISSSQVPPPPPHQQTVGSGDSDADGEQWSCSACTLLNHPALNKCECCEMPRMTVAPIPPQPDSPGDIPDTYPTPVQTAQST